MLRARVGSVIRATLGCGDGRRVRFDDAVGAGWRLVTLAEAALDPHLAGWFATIGGAVEAFSCGDRSPRDVGFENQ